MSGRGRAVAASLLLAGLLVACASDGGTSSPASSSTADGASTTAASSDPPTSEPSDGTLVVEVFFLDEDAFNVGRPPFAVPAERTVDAKAPAAAALDELFAGPTAQERASGLRFVGSDATGFDQLRIEDGTAHVTLVGGCSSGGSTFTVADELAATLRQFTTVDAVKIYDPDGQTAAPDEPGDSIPACLEP